MTYDLIVLGDGPVEGTVHCVYPILTKDSKLCLGLWFNDPNTDPTGDREFIGRSDQEIQQNGVHSIHENIFNECPNRPTHKPNPSYTKREQTPTVGIYVGAGARLLVSDHRRGCRTVSLFQQGSFFVVEAEVYFRILGHNRSLRDLYDEKNNEFLSPHFWTFIEKEEQIFQSYVIFLGAFGSRNSTICWYFDISETRSEANTLTAYLSVPENGAIDDILAWNKGLEYVYRRHAFERLYRRVLRSDPDYMSTIPEENPGLEIVRRIVRSDDYYNLGSFVNFVPYFLENLDEI